MKKNLISLAVAASVLGGAAAQAGQYVSPNGTGQVILFPFYNADNGNATNMHVVNTSSDAKAIKVRFVEYKNSDEVLDFNLYLSPKDHFAFGVIKNPNGTGGAVITQDNSCTVPALGSANPPYDGTATVAASGATTRVQPFVNYQYANGLDVDSTIERTLTGHVEVIEMGVLNNVPNTTAALTADQKKTQYASFAKHGANGVPAACATLNASWAAGAFVAGGVTQPSGGLYGLAYHINVEAAAAFGFEPTAIDDWSEIAQHTNPGTNDPSIVKGQAKVSIHLPADANNMKEITMTGTDASAQAVSAALTTASISNDVMVNPAIGGMTDWVVTFPTKNYHVDHATTTDVVAPFTANWLGTSGTTTKKEVPACEAVSITQYNREEQTTTQGLQFSPKPAGTTSKICNEVAVIAMGPTGTASALSVTTGKTNLASTYAEGWQQIGFAQSSTNGGYKITGLPVIGFGAYKVNNGAMSYGNAAEHKYASVAVVSS